MTREEAIDIIRKNIPHLGIGAAEMTEALNELIPELRESEDERVRKAIDEILKLDEVLEIAGKYNLSIVAIRGGLTKQKEQKPVDDDDPLNDPRFIDGFDTGREVQKIFDEPTKWSEEDERILKGIIGKIDHDQTYGVSKDEMLNFLKKL